MPSVRNKRGNVSSRHTPPAAWQCEQCEDWFLCVSCNANWPCQGSTVLRHALPGDSPFAAKGVAQSNFKCLTAETANTVCGASESQCPSPAYMNGDGVAKLCINSLSYCCACREPVAPAEAWPDRARFGASGLSGRPHRSMVVSGFI